MATILSFVATILSGLIKSWLGQNTANKAQQTVIANQIQVESDEQTIVALKARADFTPYTADQLRNLKPGSDANFRD